MLRKLLVFAITSGLAARLYRRYASRRSPPVTPVRPAATRRRRAGASAAIRSEAWLRLAGSSRGRSHLAFHCRPAITPFLTRAQSRP